MHYKIHIIVQKMMILQIYQYVLFSKCRYPIVYVEMDVLVVITNKL